MPRQSPSKNGSTPAARVEKCILSIDVGVRNLAMSILIQSRGEIDMVFWKWYDVTGDGEDEAPSAKKKKKVEKGVELGTCQNIVRKTGKPCGRPGIPNGRGRAYCGVHDPSTKHNPQDTQLWCWRMLKSLPKISSDVDAALKPWKERGSVDALDVVIEQQSVDNKKILLQSHLIYGHFVDHFENRVTVRFVPAFNKLYVYDGPEIVCNLKTPYAKRKYLAKKHTEYFLNNMPKLNCWKPFFESCKTKQDDISDAFLQGLYILKGRPRWKEDGDSAASGKRRRRKIRF